MILDFTALRQYIPQMVGALLRWYPRAVLTSFVQTGRQISPSLWQKRGWQVKDLFVPEVEPGGRRQDSLSIPSSTKTLLKRKGKRRDSKGIRRSSRKSQSAKPWSLARYVPWLSSFEFWTLTCIFASSVGRHLYWLVSQVGAGMGDNIRRTS